MRKRQDKKNKKKRQEFIFATVRTSFDELSKLYATEDRHKLSDEEFFENTDSWIS